jgi:hypothetical protein
VPAVALETDAPVTDAPPAGAPAGLNPAYLTRAWCVAVDFAWTVVVDFGTSVGIASGRGAIAAVLFDASLIAALRTALATG